MGAARKLQSEIDRCLKKVQEGIDEFDQIWQKVHDTENANQKEKFEADLKKEIKKLQRLRDQIKSWISGADIKDKSALMEARKSIEREMERFKTCEKEAKMKQFSKAALGQADKLDPKEQAKAESREWINDMVDRLHVAIEAYEYEMEELAAGLKKKAKPPPRLVQLEEVVTVHKKHTSALEKALRCLDNDAITSEEIDPLKDDLDYYMGMELDEHYDNTDDMYCDIADRLEAVEAAAPAASLVAGVGAHMGVKAKDGKPKGSGGGGKDDEEREKEKERERERAAAAAVKAQLIAQGNSNVKPLEEDERPKSGPHGVLPRPPPLSSSGSGAAPGSMPLPSPLEIGRAHV